MGRIIYLLDSNILSEPVRREPDAGLMDKLEEHDGEYATAAIVWHELNFGCNPLPASKRKTQLLSYLSMLRDSGLVILPFEERAAEWFAMERARLKTTGQSCAYADGEIAAIAAVNNLILVTRNTPDFAGFQNLTVHNWFQSELNPSQHNRDNLPQR